MTLVFVHGWAFDAGFWDPLLAELDGLHWLLRWDGRAAMDGEKVQALAGRNDPIVPDAMTAGGFAGHPIHWHGGGHLLPITHPRWCADRIRECL